MKKLIFLFLLSSICIAVNAQKERNNSIAGTIQGTITVPVEYKPRGEVGTTTFSVRVYELQNVVKDSNTDYLHGKPVRVAADLAYGSLTQKLGTYVLPITISGLSLNPSPLAQTIYLVELIPTFKGDWLMPFGPTRSNPNNWLSLGRSCNSCESKETFVTNPRSSSYETIIFTPKGRIQKVDFSVFKNNNIH